MMQLLRSFDDPVHLTINRTGIDDKTDYSDNLRDVGYEIWDMRCAIWDVRYAIWDVRYAI